VKIARAVLAAAALGTACLIVRWSCTRPAGVAESAPPGAPLAGPPASALGSEQAASPRSSAVVDPPQALALDPAELAALLREAAQAWEAIDRPALERVLARLLADPARALAIAAWLQGPQAAQDPAACSGALLALEAALELFDQPAARDEGAALVRALLAGLPALDARLRPRLIAVLCAARSARGPVFDARFLRDTLALRRAHPELAAELGPLLEHAGESLGGPEQQADFRRLFLQESDDPALVKLALASLLATDPGTFLPLAEELYARAAQDPALRAAIAQAIAGSAPVAEAAAMLARLADDGQYAQFQTLGSRPGALDALAAEYDALLASGGNARGRKLLVSGMRAETSEVLLGIARLDPDANVRLQALLTLTIRGPVEAGVVRELTALRADGGRSGQGGLTTRSTLLVARTCCCAPAARRARPRATT
jgi:hypothetical protein